MAKAQQIFWIALRLLYGLFFLLTGIWIVISVTTAMVGPPPQPTPGAAAFMDALAASGFMDPLIAASFILGGGLLLSSRTAPAGLVVLAPAVSVILLFHLLLSGQAIVGILVAAIFLVLAWHYRRAFVPLLTWQPDGRNGQAD